MKSQSRLCRYAACLILILPSSAETLPPGFQPRNSSMLTDGLEAMAISTTTSEQVRSENFQHSGTAPGHEPMYLAGLDGVSPHQPAPQVGKARIDSGNSPREGEVLLRNGPAADSEKLKDPFLSGARVTVLVFVHPECPISNRYAPEIQRLASRFKTNGVAFWLVYPDADLSQEDISRHAREYRYSLPLLRDETHSLVKKSKARVTPEAAVFDAKGRLWYHGRIDDRYVDFGKARPEPTRRDLQEAIEACVAGKRLAEKETLAIGCNIWERK